MCVDVIETLRRVMSSQVSIKYNIFIFNGYRFGPILTYNYKESITSY